MPVYNVEKRLRLMELGYNPDELEEFTGFQEPEAVQQNPTETPKTTTSAGVISRSFARGIPSVLGGIGAGALTGAAGGAVAGPIGAGIGTILGSLGGGFGTRALQENVIVPKLLPEELARRYREQQETDIRERPLEATIGEIASGLFGLKPTLKTLPGAGRALRDIIQRNILRLPSASPAAASDIGNLANVGLGAALPVGARLAFDENVTLPEIAAEAIGGALLSEPNRVGRKLGLKPNIYREDLYKDIAARSRASEPIKPTPGIPMPGTPLRRQGEQLLLQAPETTKPTYSDIAETIHRASELRRQQAEAENTAAKIQANEAETARLKAETARIKAQAPSQADLETLEETIKGRQLTQPEQLPVRKPLPERKALRKEEQKVEAELTKPPTEGEVIQDQYDKGVKQAEEGTLKELNKARVTPIARGLEEQGISATPTKYFSEVFKKRGEQLNIEVDDSGRVFDKKTGKEIAGTAFARQGLEKTLAKINPNKADLTIYPHELTHIFRDDLLMFGDKLDKEFVTKGDRLMEQSPAYQQWKKLREAQGYNSSVDEYARTLDGEEAVRRLFNTDKEGKIKRWFKDFWTHIKFKYGNPTDADISRLMSNRMLNDPGFSERYAIGLSIFGLMSPGEEAKQAEESPFTPEDRARGDRFSEEQLRALNDYNNFKEYLMRQNDPEVLKEGFEKLEKLSAKLRQLIPVEPQKNAEEGSLEGGLEITKIPSSMMSFSRRSSSLENYYSWLREVKKLSAKQAAAEVRRIAGHTEREVLPFFESDSVSDRTSRTEEVPPTEDVKISEEGTLKSAEEPSPIKTTTATPEAAPVVRDTKDHLIPLLRSEVDKIDDIGTPKAEILASAYRDFYDKYTTLRGKLNNVTHNNLRRISGADNLIENILKNPKDVLKQDTPELRSTFKKMLEVRDGGTPEFTPKEQEIREEVQRVLKQVRDMQRERKGLRKIKEDDPNYVPHITKWSAIKVLLEKPESAEALKLKKDFIDYQSKKLAAKGEKNPKEVAAENFEKLVNGYSKKNVDIASQYGPIDEAEGLGLPESWREENLLNALQRYLDRVSRRFAYYDTFESKGDVQEAYNTYKTNEHVKTVHNNVTGIVPIEEQTLNALMGITRASQLGPLTGSRDFTANFTLGFQHHQNPYQALRNGLKALGSLKENLADAYETGRIRTHMNDLEWGDIIGNMRRIRDIISSVQGRNFLEKITRAVAMGQGKLGTLDFHQQYLNGELSAAGQRWFNNFAKGIDWKKDTLTREDLLTIASRYIDSVQGTYDYRGLPKFAMEGQLSPIFALARWNIEKANNYNKYVLQPLLRGEVAPFLNSTVGMILGGTAVTALTEYITGRKEKVPKIKEIKEAKEKGLPTLYKALALASASGYAGILSDTAKSIMDRMYAKNKPRWYNNILLDTANNVSASVMSLGQALAEEGFSAELMFDFVSKLVEDNLQAARLILAHTGAETKEDIERINKLRDLRVFNTLEGNKIADFSVSDFTESFTDSDLKRFKRTTDPQEAAKLLPEILQDAIERAEGNPERLTKELTRIKRTSYQTMPNPSTMPVSFRNYILFLKKTQGKEVASERLADYFKRNTINKAKSSMVP